jgi:LysM repeat protein
LSETASAKVAPATVAKSERPTVVASTRSDDSKVAKAPPKPVVKDDRKSDHGKPAESNSTKSDVPKIYVVAKGDNPVSIARKLKVPYDDLMTANHIEDPHKLQIGQKLIIPVKPAKPKKSGE